MSRLLPTISDGSLSELSTLVLHLIMMMLNQQLGHMILFYYYLLRRSWITGSTVTSFLFGARTLFSSTYVSFWAEMMIFLAADHSSGVRGVSHKCQPLYLAEEPVESSLKVRVTWIRSAAALWRDSQVENLWKHREPSCLCVVWEMRFVICGRISEPRSGSTSWKDSWITDEDFRGLCRKAGPENHVVLESCQADTDLVARSAGFWYVVT